MAFADVYDPSGSLPASTLDYPIVVSATAPTSPWRGLGWLNSGNNQLSVWNGTKWVVTSGTVGGGGSALPTATAQDQLLKSGPGPTYSWTLSTLLDGGRF